MLKIHCRCYCPNGQQKKYELFYIYGSQIFPYLLMLRYYSSICDITHWFETTTAELL